MARGDRHGSGDVGDGDPAQRKPGEKAHAADVDEDRILDDVDGTPEDVGVDPAPHLGVGATTDEPDVIDTPLDELLDIAQQPPRVERDALEDGADEVVLRCREGLVEEGRAHGGVLHRCPLPVEPRREDDTVTPGRHPRRDPVERFVDGAERRVGRELVVAETEVLGEVGEAGTGGLLFVGEEPPPREGRRQRRHVVEQVGLLVRDVTDEPRRCAQVQVAGSVGDGAGSDRRRVQVRCAHDDGDALRHTQLGCRAGQQRAEDRSGWQQVRERARVDAERGEQHGLIVDGADVAVVGDPVQRDRVVPGGGAAGETEVQVVLRLEEQRGVADDVRAMALQPQDVPHRVLARLRRGASGEPDPAQRFADVVPLQPDRPADDVGDEGCAPGVHPDDRVTDVVARGVDGHGAGPLRRAGDGGDVTGRGAGRVHDRPHSHHDRRPPPPRVLFGASTGQQRETDRFEVPRRDHAGTVDEGNLGPGRPEVDGEDVLGGVPAHGNRG